MEEQQRQFKGIWIPKEVWESKELTLQQKVMLVEIDSLDNEKGCYASNKYFSEFFGISNGRVSQVINELVDKGYLNAEYIKEDNQILARVLKIQSPPYPVKVFRKLNRGYLENDEGGIKYSKGGYLENDKDNNINNNNINNNIYIGEFEEIWKAYPNKKGKDNSRRDYIKARKDGVTYETIVNGLKKYLMYCKKEKKWYKPKNGSTWFHQRSWNDEYEIEITTEDLQMDLTDF